MNVRLLILTVAALLVVATVAAGPVVAADNSTEVNSTTTTTTTTAAEETTTATATPTTTTTTQNASDRVEREMWSLFAKSQAQANKTTAAENTIIQTIGPGTWVTDKKFYADGSADLTITTKRSISLTFTDSSAIDPEKTSGTFQMESQTIPRGTYTIRVPATVADDGNQLVTITGGKFNVYVSNGVVQQGTNWFKQQPVYAWFAWVGIAIVIGVALYLIRRIRKQDKGAIENADGAELTKDFRHGLEHIETDEDEPDEGGDDDE